MLFIQLDRWAAALLAPLAAWVLISGLDDLVLLAVRLWQWVRTGRGQPGLACPTDKELDQARRRRIAIMVPLWKEWQVVRGMVEHNVAANRYDCYDIFIGAYPNDGPTLAAVREVERRFPNVHLAVLPHDGPTSKADCLNWIFQRLLMYEEEHRALFDIVMTHDAEDLIHPESLRWVNYYVQKYDMVQIPVLPLPTPAGELTHGVYCDEFAEFQMKDLAARQYLGGFIPSCGVGTAFSREAIERLAVVYSNRIFEPQCLTEDYENGFRVHALGCSQVFLPPRRVAGSFVATREYFPRRFGAAVRQRTRWMIGIALQSWELHGWRETGGHLYWFWRDRKGLAGNLVSPLANLLFLYGAGTWLWSLYAGSTWGLGRMPQAQWMLPVWFTALALQTIQMSVRMGCSARVYGWRFAWAAPIRAPVGNCINFVASIRALQNYLAARWSGRPLVWLKTEHAYPSRAALMEHKRRLGEVLVGSQYVSSEDLESALASKPETVRLGEHLVQLGKLTEDELYDALSLQQNLAIDKLRPHEISPRVARTLPVEVARRWRVLPFKLASGQLFVAGPELPSDEMTRELKQFSGLEIRFQLITPSDFAVLEEHFLR